MTIEILHPRETDAQKAEQILDAVRPILEQLAAVITETERKGMRLEFAIGRDAFGRHIIQHLHVLKVL